MSHSDHIRQVLTNPDLLCYITDFNTDDIAVFIRAHRNTGLARRCKYLPYNIFGAKVAAKTNNLSAMRILWEQNIMTEWWTAIKYAVKIGNIDMLEFLAGIIPLVYTGDEKLFQDDNYNTFVEYCSTSKLYQISISGVLYRAARTNNISVLEWTVEKLCKSTKCTQRCCTGFTDQTLIDILCSSILYGEFTAFKYLAECKLYTKLWANSIKRMLDYAYAESINSGDTGLSVMKYLYNRFPDAFTKYIEEDSSVETDIVLALQQNNVPIVQWFTDNFKFNITPDVLQDLCISGHSDAITWVIKNVKYIQPFDTVREFKKDVNVETLKLLKRYLNYAGYSPDVLDDIARYGDLETIKYFHDNIMEMIGPYTLANAAEENRLDVIQYYHSRFPQSKLQGALRTAINRNHLQLAKWLYQHIVNKSEILENTIETRACNYNLTASIKANNIEMLRWLYVKLPIIFHNAKNTDLVHVLKHGSLEIVKWIYSVRPDDFTLHSVNIAAKYGRLDLLKWLLLTINPNLKCTGETINMAIESENTEVLIWLHNNTEARLSDFNWNQRNGNNIVCRGNVTMIAWILKNYPEYNNKKLHKAVNRVNFICLRKWLTTNYPLML